MGSGSSSICVATRVSSSAVSRSPRSIPPNAAATARACTGLPIDGTTLLHLAFDFHEAAVAAWLLARGADPNARASVDADGFGGHTPLFNAVVCGPWHHEEPTRRLLQSGASKDTRASLRKFLDWIEEPRWHEARDVTALQWARAFPDQSWTNRKALHLPE